jgi:hypothetical protein
LPRRWKSSRLSDWLPVRSKRSTKSAIGRWYSSSVISPVAVAVEALELAHHLAMAGAQPQVLELLERHRVVVAGELGVPLGAVAVDLLLGDLAVPSRS